MRRFICFLLLLAVCSGTLIGCSHKEESDAMGIADAYIDGFYRFYEAGAEYAEQGLQLQADYAFGWAAASVSSMRYCIDCLLYLKGEGETLEDVVAGRLDDWDKIAAYNYVSPYPHFFEGLVCHIQDMETEALGCYEKAIVNPAFNAEYGESLTVLAGMQITGLKSVKERLAGIEDRIFSAYQPERTDYPRHVLGFDDKYLRTLAREALEACQTDYREALRHYKAALAVNPFDGDNFVGCALMHLHMDEAKEAIFYVNEGLFVDPEHQGLNRIADVLNGEVQE